MAATAAAAASEAKGENQCQSDCRFAPYVLSFHDRDSLHLSQRSLPSMAHRSVAGDASSVAVISVGARISTILKLVLTPLYISASAVPND
jgi:hypothetical protein